MPQAHLATPSVVNPKWLQQLTCPLSVVFMHAIAHHEDTHHDKTCT